MRSVSGGQRRISHSDTSKPPINRAAARRTPHLDMWLIIQIVLCFYALWNRISEFLERHSKAKRTRAPAYLRELRRIKEVVQRLVHAHGQLRSDFSKGQRKRSSC